MLFNPLFIQTSGSTDTTAVLKQPKLANPSYLFSDIIRIINENITEDKVSTSIKNETPANLFTNFLNDSNNSSASVNKDLIPLLKDLNNRSTNIPIQNFPLLTASSNDLQSLVQKLAALLNKLGISPESIKTGIEEKTTLNNNAGEVLSTTKDIVDPSKNTVAASQIVIDLTSKSSAPANAGKVVDNQNENSSNSLEAAYSIFQSLFSKPNIDQNLLSNSDQHLDAYATSEKSITIKDKPANNENNISATILSMLQTNNAVDLTLKLGNGDLKLEVTKAGNNVESNIAEIGTGSSSKLVNDQLQNKNLLKIFAEIPSGNSASANENIITKDFNTTNTLSDSAALTNSKILSQTNPLADNTDLINQLFEKPLNENSPADINAAVNFYVNKNQETNLSLPDGNDIQKLAVNENLSESTHDLLKSLQNGKAEIKTNTKNIDKVSSLIKDISLQDSVDPKIQLKNDSSHSSSTITNKMKQTILKDVENIQQVRKATVDKIDISVPDKIPEQIKPQEAVISAEKKPEINNDVKSITAQPVDKVSDASNESNQSAIKPKDDVETVQTISNKPENSSNDQQQKNTSDNSKNNEVRFIPNQLNDFKSNIDSVKEKILQSNELPDQSYKTIKVTDVVNEISNLVKDGNTNSVILNLKPESLGRMKVTVDVSNNTVHANVEVDTESVKLIVQNNINDLKNSLNLNGMQLSSLTVNVSGGEQKFNRSLGQKKKQNYQTVEQKLEISGNSLATKSMGYNTYEYLI